MKTENVISVFEAMKKKGTSGLKKLHTKIGVKGRVQITL